MAIFFNKKNKKVVDRATNKGYYNVANRKQKGGRNNGV